MSKAEQKGRSRDRILDSAGTLLREKGIAGTSVAQVMDGADMTVGGFYAHFPSKDALVAETLQQALRESLERFGAAAEGKSGSDAVYALAQAYLSRSHRDNPSLGCPLPATAGELAAADEEVRGALAVELEAEIEELASQLLEAGVDKPRAESLALISLMVGGMTLARALSGTDLSDEVLKSCRQHVKRSLNFLGSGLKS